MELIVANLNKHFSSLKNGETSVVNSSDVSVPKQNSEPSRRDVWSSISTAQGFGTRFPKNASGVSYGQPTFFSPVYTPINWQIPSRRREVYMWCRYFYENEPRVATCLDFHSRFPITGFETECSNRYVKHFFDDLNKKLNMDKWLRIISHETILLGDCFPFLEVECPNCGGSGRIDGQICEHEGGSFKRLLILNPDFIEVFTNSISPEDVIMYVPDDELRDLVIKKGPGSSKLSPEVRKMIAEGRPIPLDTLSISHLKHGESGYRRYGISMLRRLFPILSYKTKIMTAQWIVAERMILPIKVVKVGTEERPASDNDIAAVQAQLLATQSDPNLCLVTHHAFELDFFGASGKVLQVSSEYEFINQEIIDGFGLNKALINGEGPTYSSAAIGAEIMIRRLESWRLELKRWIEQKIYLPVAKMRGFVEKNEWGEEEFIYPKIKWDNLNLRDRQNERNLILQLYDKGLISATRVLNEFEIDADTEFEQIRYEKIELMDQKPPGQSAGMGGMPPMGGGGGGGMGDVGGGMSMGGGMDSGSPPPGMEGGGPGTAPTEGEGPTASSDSIVVTSSSPRQYVRFAQNSSQADPGAYGGKVLSPETRSKIDRERAKLVKQKEKGHIDTPSGAGSDGFLRDNKGRIFNTSIQRKVIKEIDNRQKLGQINYNVSPEYEVATSPRHVFIDIAFPDLKIGIECDGQTYHGSPDQKRKDAERDKRLSNLGWTIIRFDENEIKSKIGNVINAIIHEITKKENWLKHQKEHQKKISKEEKLDD